MDWTYIVERPKEHSQTGTQLSTNKKEKKRKTKNKVDYNKRT